MKSILISIRPEWVAKILNGEKTIEIRKTAPKCDLPIVVYIYCTKSKDFLLDKDQNFFVWDKHEHHYLYEYEKEPKEHYFQGKVVAKFTLWNVTHYCNGCCLEAFELKHDQYLNVLEDSCLTEEQLLDYADDDLSFTAWRIDDLVIFDEPMEITDFFKPYECGELPIPLTRVPQSWCYVEANEE